MPQQEISIASVTPQDFFINQGLYISYQYNEFDVYKAEDLIYYKGHIESHCIECGQDSIFNPKDLAPQRGSAGVGSEKVYSRFTVSGPNNAVTVERRFFCSRAPEHELVFTILANHNKISKIGQFPSYADISLHSIEKYKKLLPNDLFIEFKKSIGLYSHNVGAGSIVYLRRIIEKFIIEPAYLEAKKNNTWDDDLYQRSRVRDRIKLLNEHLPDYLVKNSVIYGIVSAGIHELSENDCLKYFPVLRSFIEVVLTDMKNEKDKEQTRRKLSDDLSSIAKDIKSS